MLGWTREEQIAKLRDEMCSIHINNILLFSGRGSFFLKDLKGIYNLKKDRTIDIDLVVDDVDSYYQKYNSILGEKRAQQLAQINKKTPLYWEDPSQDVRYTIIPQDQLESWTSLRTSSIGYFLIGRWQKPLFEEYVADSFGTKFTEIKERIYDEGVKLALQTYGASLFGDIFRARRNFSEIDFDNVIKGHATIENIIEHLYHLSYSSEGIRTLEAFWKRKPHSCLNRALEESKEIYTTRILTEAQNMGLRLNDDETISFNTEEGHFNQAKKNLGLFKEWAAPRSAYVMYYLNQIYENPFEYTKDKIGRSAPGIIKMLGLHYPLALIKDPNLSWKLARLPNSELNDREMGIISNISDKVSKAKMHIQRRTPVQELCLII